MLAAYGKFDGQRVLHQKGRAGARSIWMLNVMLEPITSANCLLMVGIQLRRAAGGVRQTVAVVHGAVAAFPNVVVGGGNVHA